jgi:ATP-dependent Zn protease
MDKNVLITTLIMGIVGMLALNIQHVIRFLTEHIVNVLFYSIKIDDSSPFYYAMQKYVKSERMDNVKNFYYKNFWDNWVSRVDGKNRGKKIDNLFFSYGHFFVKFNNKRIFLSKTNRVVDNSMDPWKSVKQSITLYSFNKKVIFDLLHHIESTYYNDTINYYFNSDGETKMLGPIGSKQFEHIFLNDNLVETIRNDVDKFINSEEQYCKLGIKYKRTYLFYGPAGTGKSSLATAIANHSGRNILSINVSKDMTDATLIKVIAGRPDKAIILFEDIDCLFANLKRSESVEESKEGEKKDNSIKVTLSCILNILDGAYTPEDVIFILTTNHIDKLDDAIRRDGRTDLKLEITRPNVATITRYLEYVHDKTGKPINIDVSEDTSLATLEKLLL